MPRAEQFRLLHRAPPLLVLPNARDVASAKAFAALPGYPIGAPFEAIGALAAGSNGPVNALASPENPRLAELERLGVTRVTFGTSLARFALAEASRLAAAALGSQPSTLGM